MLLALFVIAFLLGTLALCIVFHEAGHYLYFFHMINRKVKFHIKKKTIGFKILVGDSKDYKGLSLKEYRNLCAWGIIAGLIPILLLLVPLFYYNIAVIVFLLYVLGSVSDIRSMISATKELKDYVQ